MRIPDRNPLDEFQPGKGPERSKFEIIDTSGSDDRSPIDAFAVEPPRRVQTATAKRFEFVPIEWKRFERSERLERSERPERSERRKRSFREEREFAELPARVDALEAERGRLREEMAKPDFYKAPADRIRDVMARLEAIEPELEQTLARWLELENR